MMNINPIVEGAERTPHPQINLGEGRWYYGMSLAGWGFIIPMPNIDNYYMSRANITNVEIYWNGVWTSTGAPVVTYSEIQGYSIIQTNNTVVPSGQSAIAKLTGTLG